jgi:hypothetical protein
MSDVLNEFDSIDNILVKNNYPSFIDSFKSSLEKNKPRPVVSNEAKASYEETVKSLTNKQEENNI